MLKVEHWFFRLTLLTLFMTVGESSESFSQDDHPLVSRYAGSTIQKKDAEEFGQYKFVAGQTPKGEFTGEINRRSLLMLFVVRR